MENKINFFNLAQNDNFFSILNCNKQHIYMAVICELYSITSTQAERRIDRIAVKQIIDKIAYEAACSENEDNVAIDANDIIRKLADTSWITIQYDGIQGCYYIYMTDYAYSFVRFNYDFEKRSSRIKTGEYLFTILNITNEMTDIKDVESDIYRYPFRNGLYAIKANVGELMNEISHIVVRMKQDIAAILQVKDRQDLVNKLTDYMKEVNGGYIANMYKHSNITYGMRQKMSTLLNVIRSDESYRERILKDMKDAYESTGHFKTDLELNIELDNLIYEIDDAFCHKFQKYKTQIDTLKADIVDRAVTKLHLLSPDSASLVTLVSKIADGLMNVREGTESEVEEIIKPLFGIHRNVSLKPSSVFERGAPSKSEIIEPITEVVVTEEDIEKAAAHAPSLLNIANDYAQEMLGDSREIEVKSIDETIFSADKIILIGMYADYKDSIYGIEILDEKITKNNYEMNNFIIRRKYV